MTKITKVHSRKLKANIKNASDEILLKFYKEPGFSGPMHNLIRQELIRRKNKALKDLKHLKNISK